MRFKKKDVLLPEIARQLRVDALLEGAVLRDGDEVRITLELVHGETDRRLNTWKFQRPLRDILALQADVARTIARDMKISLTGALGNKLRPGGAGAKSVDPRAYESYAKGRYAFNNAGGGVDAFRNAIAFYEKAIEIDPTFALAYAALAEVCLQPPVLFAEIRTRGSCETAARTAVRLDEGLAEAHAALGDVLADGWAWQESEVEFQRALQLNPNSVLAHQHYSELLRTTMRFTEAEQQIKLAAEIDPFNLFVKTMVGWPLWSQKRYDEALAAWAEVLELDPDYGLALYNEGFVYAMLNMPERVLESARRAAKRMGENSLAILGLTALGHARQGDRAAAKAILLDLEQRDDAASIPWIANVHLALGEDREALAWLEKGVTEHAPLAMTSEPWYDPLRGEPRFQEIRRRIGLPP
jgi:tetratricopeptide (TPR) repeat protein